MNAPALSDLETASGSAPREVVLLTGKAGSGKSVALHALEDSGYFCVDNLPPELLNDLIRVETGYGVRRLAVAVDARTATSLPILFPLLDQLRSEGVMVRIIFLSATKETLVSRFSESRRPHPLSRPHGRDDARRALIEALDLEHRLLADLRERATVIDTSQLRPAQLRAWMREMVGATGSRLTLIFQSFAFKHGVPLDADLMFDVRVLPNPFYVPQLRLLTGRDAPVVEYLEAQPAVAEMLTQIEAFVRRWLPAYEDDLRGYLTVAIGCTGGQHRSVYMVETLAGRFQADAHTLARHREIGQS